MLFEAIYREHHPLRRFSSSENRGGTHYSGQPSVSKDANIYDTGLRYTMKRRKVDNESPVRFLRRGTIRNGCIARVATKNKAHAK
jgi:hypothetical protein